MGGKGEVLTTAFKKYEVMAKGGSKKGKFPLPLVYTPVKVKEDK